MISITSVAVFLVGLSALFAMNGVMKKNQKLLYNTIANSLVYSSYHIRSILQSVEVTSSMIIADRVIQDNLVIMNNEKASPERNIASRKLYDTLHTYYFSFNNKYLDYMCLYYEDTPIPTNACYTLLPSDKGYQDIKNTAYKYDGAIQWLSSYGDEKGLLLVRSIRQIKNMSLDTLGFLTIKIDMNEIIQDATNFGNQFSNASFILLDNKEVLYCSDSISESEAETLMNLNSNYDVVALGKHQYFAVKDIIPEYNLDYICLVSYDSIQQYISKIYIFYILIIVVSILLSLSLSTSLVQNIIKHFEFLIEKMRAFQDSDMKVILNLYDYSNRQDELGIIHTHFDTMANKIKDLVQKNYINEILRKDAQLKALESQIDPHFLYNTLESVNWRARAIGERQISLMVESLGNLLRATLDHTAEDFSLKEELKLVEYYMTIQQIRYEDRLQYQLIVDSTLLDASLPKLSIQPLVENAIRYALEEITEECYICLTVSLNGTHIEIRVKNNGSQFEEDLLNKLKKKEIHPHGFGIGLINIDQRIKLKFGNHYGLTFYNEEDFAIAMITIPYVSTKMN